MISNVAHADVQLVSQIHISGAIVEQGNLPASRTCTLSCKQGWARVESTDGHVVVLCDSNAKQVYLLYPDRKTYSVAPFSAAEAAKMAQRLSKFVDIQVTGAVAPIHGGKSQSVVGVSTLPYSVLADIHVEPKGGAASTTSGSTNPGMAVHVEGQFRGAPIATLVPAATVDRMHALEQEILQASGWIPGPLLTSFAQQDVIPLKGTVAITRTVNSVPRTSVVSMEVQSLNENASLSESLFRVPSDYHQVAAPKQNALLSGVKRRF